MFLKDPSGGPGIEVPCGVHLGINPDVPEEVQTALQHVASSDNVVEHETAVVALQLAVGLAIAIAFRSAQHALAAVLGLAMVIAIFTRLLQWALRKNAFEVVWQYHQRCERKRALCPTVGKLLILPIDTDGTAAIPKRVVLDYGERAVTIEGGDAARWASYVWSLPHKGVGRSDSFSGWYWHDAGMLCTVKIDPPDADDGGRGTLQ